MKIKIYRSLILTVVLYGCETWSLPLKQERRLRLYENRMVRRILGLEGRGNRGVEKNYITRIFMICTDHQTLFG